MGFPSEEKEEKEVNPTAVRLNNEYREDLLEFRIAQVQFIRSLLKTVDEEIGGIGATLDPPDEILNALLRMTDIAKSQMKRLTVSPTTTTGDIT